MCSTAGVSLHRRTFALTVRILTCPVALLAAVGCSEQHGLTPTGPDFASAPSTPALNLAPSQDPVVFGPVTVPFSTATPTTVTFTISNAGTKPSGKISVSITGSGAAAYSIKKGDNGCSGSLRPSSSCTVKVTFLPSVIGTYLAMLSVSTPRVQPVVTANLSGFGGGKFTVQQLVTSGSDVTGNYSTTGGLSPSSFSLSNGQTQSFTALGAGTYTATLTMPFGYSLDTSSPFGSMSCSGNYDVGDLTLDPNTNTFSFTIENGSVNSADCIIRIYQST